jgi:hypothetical protein
MSYLAYDFTNSDFFKFLQTNQIVFKKEKETTEQDAYFGIRFS